MPEPAGVASELPELLAAYWAVGSVVWAGLTLLAWALLNRERQERRAAAQALRHNRANMRETAAPPPVVWVGGALLIVVVAAGLRIGPVVAMEPTLSDDIWRYQFDGAMFQQGISPYLYRPEQVYQVTINPQLSATDIDLDADTAAALPLVNNPTLFSIYQPASQWVFAGTMVLHDWVAQGAWSAHRTFRGVFSAIDLLIVVVLLLVLWHQHRSAWWAALYAWHPLAVTETAWSGHQDVIGVLAVVCMLACFTMVRGRRDAAQEYPDEEPNWLADACWAFASGLCFATAIAVKPVVAPLALPLTVIAWRRQWGVGLWLSSVVATAVGLAGYYLPFVFIYGGLPNMLATLGTFAEKWAFNSLSHSLLMPLGLEPHVATAIAAGLAGVIVLVTAAVARDVWRATMAVIFAGLLLSSTVYPWYLLWVLALLPIRFSRGVWVFSVTLPISYEVLMHPQQWRVPGWVIAFEYGSAAAGLVCDAIVFWRDRREEL